MADEIMTFDEILADPIYKAEFDRRVTKAISTVQAKLTAEVEKNKGLPSKEDYEKLRADHESMAAEYKKFRDGVAEKEAKAAKEKAVRAYFESKNIKGDNLKIAMRGSAAEIEAVKLDKDGKIEDAKALDELISGTYAGLVGGGVKIDTGAPLSGGNLAKAPSRAAQLYQDHYTALYGGAQKGQEK